MSHIIKSYLQFTVILAVAATWSGCGDQRAHYLAEGEQNLRAGNYELAKKDYMNVLEIDTYNPTACARLGQIWLDQGSPWRAGTFLKKAVELSPDDSDSRLRLAHVYQSLGFPSKAREEIVQVLKESPANGEALVTLSEIAHTPEELSEAKEAIERFPNRASASYHLALANLYSRRKEFAAASEEVKQAITLSPVSPEAHQARGLLELLQKNKSGADEAFRLAAELAPVRSLIRINYAQYLNQSAGSDAAVSYLNQLTAKAPDFLPAWISLARLAVAKQKYDDAIQYLQHVFSYDPNNIEAHLVESDVWLAQKEPARVITELLRLDKTHPGLPELKYRLGLAYFQQNNTADAAAAFDQALARNPTFTEAILARARLNIQTGHASDVVAPLEELLADHPKLKSARDLLIEAYRAAGRPDEAAKLSSTDAIVSPGKP
jgi:tetratricopeptide (TPR) repeat protein